MGSGRVEAFSDGVIAILITIMVLELKLPDGPTWAALQPLVPVFLSYLLSFVFLGIYWVNHHHLLHTVERVDGAVLWANLHLLFWLSLVPLGTGWMGRFPHAAMPTVLYGLDLLFSALAYKLLQAALIRQQGPGSTLGTAIGEDAKGKLSLMLYAVAVPLACVRAWWAQAVFVAVALLWLVPDRRIECAVYEGDRRG